MIRNKVRRIYCKQRHDFDTEEAYDDYLEEIEDKVFRLSSRDVDK